jgi:SAM-dependent methyltransferase
MRNPEHWTPSKYVWRRGRLAASHDAAMLGVGSRLVADRVAACYGEYLPRHARGRLVDLGCGSVPLYGSYRTLVSSVTCVDWAHSPHARRHVDVEADLGAALPFADASFDTLILSDVLEHVAQPERLWREMARLLAPGGHAFVNVPFLYGIHEAPHDYYRYTEFALRRFAERAGLATRVLVAIGGSLHVFADLLAKHFARLPALGKPLAIGVQALVTAFDAIDLGRRIAQRSAAHFPLGYFMVVERDGADRVAA